MIRAPRPGFKVRAATAGLLLGLVASSGAEAIAQGAGSERRSVPAYAEWASRVVASPPEGISLLPALEDRLAERAADQRREHDRPPLQRDADLQRAARAHAIDMLERDYVGHFGPEGRSVADRVGILHRRFIGTAGENLAEHTGLPQRAAAEQTGPLALKLMSGFLESPEHRKNLLNPDYTHEGIGAAGEGERLVVVHVFGARLAVLQRDLPLRTLQGAELPLAFQEGEALRTPTKYGFARPGQPLAEVVPLDVAIREVAVAPGTYRLTFFLPVDQSDGFLVAPGPILLVR